MSTQLWVNSSEMEQPDLPESHAAAMSASFILWSLSGRKYGGQQQVTERYSCPCRCSTRALTGVVYPGIHQGQMYNVRMGCGSCGNEHRLKFRGAPIRSISEVIVQGHVLDPEQYEIHDNAYLAVSSGASWSICNGVEVTYTFGVMPPEAGRRAAKLLAEELVKATIDPESCQLPDRVTSISRQGVSFTVLDPQSFLDEGRLGLYEVDSFLRSVNPGNSRIRAKVFSPDTPRGVRVRTARARIRVGPNDLVITRGTEFTKVFSAEAFSMPPDFADFDVTGQISNWNGATVLDLNSYFSPEAGDPPGSIRITLPAEITRASYLREGVFDLYAVLESDGNTVIHLLSSKIHVR